MPAVSAAVCARAFPDGVFMTVKVFPMRRPPGEHLNQRETYLRMTEHLRHVGWPVHYIERIETPEEFVRIYQTKGIIT